MNLSDAGREAFRSTMNCAMGTSLYIYKQKGISNKQVYCIMTKLKEGSEKLKKKMVQPVEVTRI